MAGSVTIGEIERFFVDEAALLDEWRLEEWLSLFTEDGRYLVPPLDAPEADHRTTLFLVADDRRNLASRVRQLLGGSTWAENPRSRTRRLVTNFRILEDGTDEVRTTANFGAMTLSSGRRHQTCCGTPVSRPVRRPRAAEPPPRRSLPPPTSGAETRPLTVRFRRSCAARRQRNVVP